MSRPPTTPRRDLPIAFSWLSATATDTPGRPRGNSVQPTRMVAIGDSTMIIPGQRVDGSVVRARDLPHEDWQQAIIWRAELRGATHTMQPAPAQIDPSLGNAWLLDGGSTTLLPPPPVPAAQRVPGAPVRPRSAVVWIIARRPYTVYGPVLWNVRAKPASREILVPGDPPETETLEYLERETGAPPAEPAGQWDTLRFTWFESIDRWSAEVQVGNLAEQADVEPEPPEEEQPDDDQDDPDNDYTGEGDPYDPDDIARPPGAGSPDDEYIDEDGNRRLRSSGRLFLLTSTSLYLLSGDGGHTWTRGNGPWSAGAAASVSGGAVHVVDGAGDLWLSSDGTQTWTRAPRGVQLAQTEAGGGNHLAIGRAGRIVIDGGAAREGDTPLGDRALTSLAYRRPSGGGSDAWEIADERRGSLDGALRDIIVNRVEDTSTGTQFWVGPRAANPTIPAGTYRIMFDRTTWLDAANSVWSPLWPNSFLTDEIDWPGGSAIDYAQAIANAFNPRTRLQFTGDYLPVPADVSATVEWVEYPDNTRRARLTILWSPRTPQPGEYPREFRPHDRLRLNGAFDFEAVNGVGSDSDWDAKMSTIKYEANLAAATPETAPNSDSFAALQVDSTDDISPLSASGTETGQITITAIENTMFGWSPAGPLPQSSDMTRSILDVSITLGSVTWQGEVGGDGLPLDQRPVVDGRINGRVVVELHPTTPATDTILTVSFPAGWRVPIDWQNLTGPRPWLGQAIFGSNATSPVALLYRRPRDGAWMIAASDGKAMLATVRADTIEPGQTTDLPPDSGPVVHADTIEPGQTTDLPPDSGPVVATTDAHQTLSVVSSELIRWINSIDDPSFWQQMTLRSTYSSDVVPTYSSSARHLVAVLPDGTVIKADVFASSAWSPSVLSGRGARITSLNYRAGRWWAAEGRTNRVYWSNDGSTWRVLPPLGTDVEAVEIEGE